MAKENSSSSRSARARRVALALHRYVGLVMSVFLVVAGLTGVVLAFYAELDRALNPELMKVEPPYAGARLLDPFELPQRVQAALPDVRVARAVAFHPKPNEAISAWVEVEHEKWREVFVNPYSGAVLGSREWGNPSEGVVNLMPFLYRLHHSLALGEVGTLLFGVIALLWTADCFVGAYLTFPARARRVAASSAWFLRWLPAWQLRAGKLFSLIFTWHRASGLWVWAMLLVFAWSAVALNLHDVYRPVMNALVGMKESVHDALPELDPPYLEPRLTLPEAHAVGKKLMAAEAEKRGFEVKREENLYYHDDHGAYSYCVLSNLDLSDEHPTTQLYFDGKDGAFRGFEAATGISAGDTITSWLVALHFGRVGGLAYRIFVAVVGIAVVLLSISGVWIWWRKREKRVSKPAPARAESYQDVLQ